MRNARRTKAYGSSTTSRRVNLSNADLAELLARQSEKESGILVRAYRRAARSAFLWPEQATSLVSENRSLTELYGVGPYMADQIRRWIDRPPKVDVKPPPIRRDFIALADARALLIENPDWPKQLRGDLQMHTRWSDGSGTVLQMGEAAAERGYEYIAITDHSKGLKIAGGIDEKQLAKQRAEIAGANRILAHGPGRTMILTSIETNLNPHGEGDMDPRALGKLDVVLGCFHSKLRVAEDQTSRYLAALHNPDIQILGHPRGRIYNYRLGLKADWARVFAAAARLDKAVEIDCYPDRQDLNPSLLRLVRNEGARISLGTDAHHPWQLEFIELGVAASLKAKVPAERIINFMPLGALKEWIRRVRKAPK